MYSSQLVALAGFDILALCLILTVGLCVQAGTSIRWSHTLVVLVCFLNLCRSLPACSQEVRVSDIHPKQGATVEVTIKCVDDESCRVISFNNHVYPLFALKEGKDQATPETIHSSHALFAVPADLRPGCYFLKAGAKEFEIQVVSAQFPVQSLRLAKASVALEPTAKEVALVAGAKAIHSRERMWLGCFRPPCRARVSTPFGVGRIVNGKRLSDYFHTGIDYAAGMGAPVVAPGAGRVVLAAMGFRLHGNTIAIDHGQGVVSFYLHLQRLLVKEGDRVETGQVIGRVGATGRASGPHLHFSLYVNRVAANPQDWFKKQF